MYANPTHEELLQRIHELEQELRECKHAREKAEAILEMAGTVRHELNQPMQALMYCEQILMNIAEDHPLYQSIQQIIENIDRMATITRKLSYVERYETKDYIEGTRIIDIDRSSRAEKE